LGLSSAANVYLFLHIVLLFLATVIFGAQFHSSGGKYAFILMVAFSAFGNYGFRTARTKHVDEKFGGKETNNDANNVRCTSWSRGQEEDYN
jgi:hypothetical protein